MRLTLRKYQREAVDKLKNGAILRGSVGSGKSLTGLAYFLEKECDGTLDDEIMLNNPKDLYIITTARKRDELDWDEECANFGLSRNTKVSLYGIGVTIDSWNNIKKYKKVEDAFFIFDEQRVVGYGAWAKTFIKISKKNRWILLSATPGDVWTDFIPVFIANGFYKHKTEFVRKHVVYNRFTKYPKIERFIHTGILIKYRNQIQVEMNYENENNQIHKDVIVEYDKSKYKKIVKKRWDIYEEEPIKNVSKLFHLMRRVVNSHPQRARAAKDIIQRHDRVIVFYNFNYELDILRSIGNQIDKVFAEWNGHKHEPIPEKDKWLYLVQYTSGAEGWNCVETNVIVFYSQNYSYKIMNQAAGRIDRLNTPYEKLYYYHLRSNAPIDKAINKATSKKKKFHEKDYNF